MADLKYLNLSFNRFNAMDHVSHRLHIGSSILQSIEFKQPTKRIQIKRKQQEKVI